MSMQIFPKLENLDLTEYAADSAYEQYTGIVLDPEDKIFKTVSGSFHDKKDFYEKLTDRGYVVRKVFEKKVFDWIEENAKTTLEAYLMFSTAFSKWKGNNLLDQYYVKLLNDIPQLNREKIKGDPNSIGDQKTEESVLDETYKQYNDPASENWPSYTITIYPENDESNELEIKNVKLNSAFKDEAEKKAQLNQAKSYRKELVKFLQTNPNFIHTLASTMDPMSRDKKFKFYDPAKDNMSPLFIDNGEQNPNRFNIKIDGIPLKNLDGTNFVLTKAIILDWSKLSGFENFVTPEKAAASKLNTDLLLNKQKTDEALLNAAANFEKTMEIIDQSEESQAQIKDAIKTLIKSDIKHYIENPENESYIPKDIFSRAQELAHDLSNFSNPNITSDQRKKLFKKYDPETRNQQQAIYNLKAQQKELYDRATKEISIPTNIDDQIKWTEQYIDNVEKHDLSDVYTKTERLQSLRAGLDALKYKKAHPKNPKSKNNLETDYSHPTDVMGDKYRSVTTGELPYNKKGGVKTKFTTTQDDLGVNQGIHSFGKESTWGNIINALKENNIPIVDDIIPCKYVNYNATQSYVNQPVDGVITSPGAGFQTGGTFFSEDSEDNVDPQWDNRAHDTLNQDLFEGTHLRPEVREALLRIAEKFKTTLGLNIEPVDIYFTGSSANFNYNEMSDIDLHLVYDFEQIGINAEILVKYFIAKKQVFNNDYDITIKGIPVEVGVENLNDPIVSTAIYSVVKDQWMLEPKDAEHLLPKPDMKQYYEIVQKIEDAIQSRNSKKIGALWDELYRIRKNSLAAEGEYGHGNGLFKKLRNLGYLDRLKHAYYSSASEELSIESLKEII